MTSIQIERVSMLPESEWTALVAESEADGFGFVRRLREEWCSTRNWSFPKSEYQMKC
jgi:hypothetical protein